MVTLLPLSHKNILLAAYSWDENAKELVREMSTGNYFSILSEKLYGANQTGQ
jgi:hypothetical protein